LKKIGLLFLLLVAFIPASLAQAHLSVEDRFYEDIEFSKAKEQIVLLRGLNVIAHDNGAKVYMPQKKLSKADLAYWSAAFGKLHEAGASRGTFERAAVERKLVDTLEGIATYRDINQAYFNGEALVDDNDQEVTREQFALYMGQFLTQSVDGKTLYERAGLIPGPAGLIDKVITQADTGQFQILVQGAAYTLGEHPVIVHGTTDLGAWSGLSIGLSWLAKEDGHRVVGILQMTDSPMAIKKEDAIQPSDPGGPPMLVIVGILFAIILGVQLYLKEKRKSSRLPQDKESEG
jgi:hypothetical protein